MTSLLEAIILGIVQGITEWLPISSSGHLVILQNLFGVNEPVFFDVMLHLGSLVVILLVFWKDIVKLVFGMLSFDKKSLQFAVYLIIASIPIALVGFFLNDYIKAAFSSPKIVGFSLLFTALVLFSTRFASGRKKLDLLNTFVMGLFQAIAILPGVSRSGTTICSGILQGVDRRKAAFFSFMLFVPAILGASFLEFGEIGNVSDVGVMFAGVIAAIVSGYFSLKLLLRIIQKGNIHNFGWYCLFLGIVILWV